MKINILGENWKIVFKPNIYHEGKEVAGLCIFNKRRLEVACAYPEESIKSEVIKQISESYWHEILHAVFYEDAMRDQAWWSEDIEHQIIAPIAKVMAKNFPVMPN